MKRLIYVFTILFLLVSSCEKPPDKGEFGNPLLKFYGDAKEDIGYSIAETDDGYIICGKLTILERDVNLAGGTVIKSENANFGLIKTNKSGKQQWTYDSGDEWLDEGRKVLVLSDGSFVCIGTVTVGAAGSTNSDILVTKVSSSGDLIWEQTYGNLYDQVGYDIINDEVSGGFLVVGSDDGLQNANIPGNRDMYILSIDASGNIVEEYKPGKQSDEVAKKALLFNGLFYVIGITDESPPQYVGPKNYNIAIVPAEFGNFNGKDYKIWGEGGDEEVSDVVSLGSEFAIVGTKRLGVDSKEGLFAKVGPGTLPDTKVFSSFDLLASSNVVELNSITLVPGVGLLAAGTTGGTDQSGDMLFMFLDSDGNNISYPETYISGGTGLQSVYDAIVDSDGKIVAVGINSYENNSLITLLKFDPFE